MKNKRTELNLDIQIKGSNLKKKSSGVNRASNKLVTNILTQMRVIACRGLDPKSFTIC